jgi:hypothetical protein
MTVEPLPKGKRPMRALHVLPAAVVLVLCGFSIARSAETTMERPFGGPPPPKSRKMGPAPKGTACKTPTITCKLDKARPVGATCTCPGSDGKPVSGKVELSL